MRVSELIDILRDQDPESEVELAIVAPVDDDSDDITVDRYTVEGVLPWEPDEASEDDEGVTVWLVGGDWMSYFRFMAPAEPFCFLLVCVGARALIQTKDRVIIYAASDRVRQVEQMFRVSLEFF